MTGKKEKVVRPGGGGKPTPRVRKPMTKPKTSPELAPSPPKR